MSTFGLGGGVVLGDAVPELSHKPCLEAVYHFVRGFVAAFEDAQSNDFVQDMFKKSDFLTYSKEGVQKGA